MAIKRRLKRNQIQTIQKLRIALYLDYSIISDWMQLTSGNLRGMVHNDLNPTQQEWDNFKEGLKNYLHGRRGKLMFVPYDKIRICERSGKEFVKFSWNAKYHPDFRK